MNFLEDTCNLSVQPMYLPMSQTYHLDKNEKTQNEETKTQPNMVKSKVNVAKNPQCFGNFKYQC